MHMHNYKDTEPVTNMRHAIDAMNTRMSQPNKLRAKYNKSYSLVADIISEVLCANGSSFDPAGLTD